MSQTKRCVLFVIDALSEPVVRRFLDKARLPALATLLEQGGSLLPCLSIFPSITPAATCSIATGEYPRRHGIEGACWLDPKNNDAAYFGDDLRLALQEGLHEYLKDFGDRLNFERLHAPLVYEHLFEQGIESACLNYMWFRGPHEHARSTPLTLRMAAGSLSETVRGPKFLKLGDFVHGLPDDVEVSGMKSGLLGRYGFHDETTIACLMALAEADALPQFTLAYFPINDDRGHEAGLEEAAATCVERFDEFLADFVETIGGWSKVGTEYSFVIVGDHGQVQWEDSPDVLKLDDLLSEFSIAETAAGFGDDDELLICPNMRAAAIYSATDSEVLRDRVVQQLLSHDGVDQVIYQEAPGNAASPLVVRTRDRGQLTFCRADEKSTSFTQTGGDRYGNQWSFRGDLSALDLRLDNGELLHDGCYPNALERIEGAFTGAASPIWVTADRRFEFAIDGTSTHDGGSHGSLLTEDSTAAVITSDDVSLERLPVPDAPRIVDVMDLCLSTLGATRGGEVRAPGLVRR
ncbi:Type I phosphodiesterase / nucleotide pyrophosphatase [Stieleria maiorica]|uniref:Type I phosphodiesterase / nucleotide pyrophosphatase n=1 Tax=Stieleria maiorica TaxID=2795974 RepID=A0A5B9MC91_9BACT|nr:alkaline phosphatase family protein [Stieleria maiorica]QEF98931.1 Type I phosphodiesterase / nucleotide pyrophosphatase [Stieleria maiorica]